MSNWSVRGPVGLARSDASGGKPAAVFLFLSEDWSPWIALVRMRERWPELRFETKAGYLQLGGSREKWGGTAC